MCLCFLLGRVFGLFGGCFKGVLYILLLLCLWDLWIWFCLESGVNGKFSESF